MAGSTRYVQSAARARVGARTLAGGAGAGLMPGPVALRRWARGLSPVQAASDARARLPTPRRSAPRAGPGAELPMRCGPRGRSLASPRPAPPSASARSRQLRTLLPPRTACRGPRPAREGRPHMPGRGGPPTPAAGAPSTSAGQTPLQTGPARRSPRGPSEAGRDRRNLKLARRTDR